MVLVVLMKFVGDIAAAEGVAEEMLWVVLMLVALEFAGSPCFVAEDESRIGHFDSHHENTPVVHNYCLSVDSPAVAVAPVALADIPELGPEAHSFVVTADGLVVIDIVHAAVDVALAAVVGILVVVAGSPGALGEVVDILDEVDSQVEGFVDGFPAAAAAVVVVVVVAAAAAAYTAHTCPEHPERRL
ncbi:hypothetical protein EDB81DRAFT_876002 [Dactylonectria macrodidyma]|uniref:Uncharacterized protein n=1 Tax=Dactylonectria macrodidyma TaxID=307937 RepID=A0A9P9JKM1_9HYPO|nr:hypothetical protein EDB81DRAFT_876002 [Dactylonectria macrodidyma]